MHLVVDIGSKQTEAGLFDGDNLVHSGIVGDINRLTDFLKDKPITAGLVASQDAVKSRELMTLLATLNLPCCLLETKEFDRLATPETVHMLEPARIANIYGALTHFPSNDCVIIDMGSKVRFDYISKNGVYLGGALFLEFEAIFAALEQQPPSPLGKTSLDQSKSGTYFGLLGAIERIVAELRLSSPTPSDVMTLATGTHSQALQGALEDFIDRVDPHLTLIGLNEILKESKK